TKYSALPSERCSSRFCRCFSLCDLAFGSENAGLLPSSHSFAQPRCHKHWGFALHSCRPLLFLFSLACIVHSVFTRHPSIDVLVEHFARPTTDVVSASFPEHEACGEQPVLHVLIELG